jgi:hypothetical protein
VDKDIFRDISRFAKRKTLHYEMWLVIFFENIKRKFFHDLGSGCVSCNFAAVEDDLALFDFRKIEF